MPPIEVEQSWAVARPDVMSYPSSYGGRSQMGRLSGGMKGGEWRVSSSKRWCMPWLPRASGRLYPGAGLEIADSQVGDRPDSVRDRGSHTYLLTNILWIPIEGLDGDIGIAVACNPSGRPSGSILSAARNSVPYYLCNPHRNHPVHHLQLRNYPVTDHI